MSDTFQKRFDDLSTLVNSGGDSLTILEQQTDLTGDLQASINKNQLTMDELRTIRDATARLNDALVRKVKKDKKAREDKKGNNT
jgi:acyl carrier protein